jgi:hypothetical protein
VKPIDVMLCVNDGRNGLFCGKLAGIDIHDFLQIDCAEIPERGCSFHDSDGYFSVHRKKFRYRGHTSWVGNWCWDSVRMEAAESARFIAFLLSQRGKFKSDEPYAVWHIDCAHGEAAIAIMEKHSRLEAISADEVLAAMKAEEVTA